MAHNESESLIKTPKQLIAAVLAGFLVPIIVITLLVKYVGITPTKGAGSNAQSPEAIAERIKPVASEGYSLKAADSGPRVPKGGEEVYKAICAGCHAAGAAGAPKFGDAGAWGARIAQGFDTLVSHAVNGIRGMPAKGGNPDLQDIEVARAVAFMGNAAGAKFKEPEAKGGAAAGGASADAGKKTYEAVCVACHGAGVGGAPKLGDKSAWGPRIAQGKDTLYKHAIQGFQGKAGMMPAKGGSSASDDEIKAAVDYMAAAAK